MSDWALDARACVAGGGDPITEALHLSFEKGVVFGGFNDPHRSFETRACLFGLKQVAQQRPDLTSLVIPITPSYVALLTALQVALSATLIFLFLMAMRNEFRIK